VIGDDFYDDFFIIDEDETEGDEEEESEPEESNPESEPEENRNQPQQLQQPQIYYSYLTGQRVSRAHQRRRPVSVIINNIRAAMPTVGVSRADIIYECTVEGGITRLMLIASNYANVPVFGSVRSSREYFIDLSRSHDAIYVHAGGNPQDYVQFRDRPIDHIDGVNMHFPDTFYRDSERRRTMSLEHTMMTSGEGILAGIRQAGYRTSLERDFEPSFKFNESFIDIGGVNNTANYVSAPYSNGFRPEFLYNPEDKLYYRKQFGAAHTDGETGEQLKFENVIVLFAEYTPYRGNDIAIREGHLACDLTGAGYGFYINGGKYKVIRWAKETRESSLYLYNRDDSDLYLNPGKSFICVTSTDYNRSVVINSDLLPVG
ncbi:MAG: DUF3048 domain-containing protein, partial [Oscillospiraceae bacterium]|nr:DUF3048 domain-containing protein [Oscillospiraceae bacterium]